MLSDGEFDLFVRDEYGVLWRKSYADLETVKIEAQQLADNERREFLLVRNGGGEIDRFFPRTKQGTTGRLI